MRKSIIGGCCGCRCWVPILIVVFATYAYGYLSAFRLRSPLPSDSELEAEGGHYFLSSTGSRLEYFDINPSSERVVVALHGSSNTGRFFSFKEYSDIAKKYNVRIIAPSVPGFGCSEPYSMSHMRNTEHLLHLFSADVISLLTQRLHISRFAVLGVSMGGEFAMSIAGEAMHPNMHRAEVVAISSINGVVFPNSKFEAYSSNMSLTYRILGRILLSQVCVRPVFSFIFAPILSGSKIDMVSSSPAFRELPASTLEFIRNDIQRSARHYLTGAAVATMSWLAPSSRPVPPYYEFLAWSDIPVTLHYGSRDSFASFSNQIFVKDWIPNAKTVPFNGTHGMYDFDDVIARISKNFNVIEQET